MTHYKMLLVELYIELMRRSSERQRFSYYARMGTLMERYRETRDESLIKQFRSIFEKELKARGLWEYDDSDDESLTRSKIVPQIYSRFDHFEDCIRTYQGTNKLNVSAKHMYWGHSAIECFINAFIILYEPYPTRCLTTY